MNHDNVIHRALKNLLHSTKMLELIDKNSINCRERGNFGLLPLHLALKNKNISVQVVEALILSYPQGCGIKACGELPIHVAAAEIQSEEIICMLLKAYPEGIKEEDDEKNFPLHRAVMTNLSSKIILLLLKEYPDACRYKNLGGSLPLHERIRWGHDSFDSILALMSAYPEAVEMKDKYDWLPLHFAVSNHQSMDIINILLNAYVNGCKCRTSAVGGHYLPLHLAVYNNSTKPLISTILKIYPHACTEQDIYGRLPLHCYLLTGRPESTDSLESLKRLVDTYPPAINIPDNLGKRPIDLCVSDTLLRILYKSDPQILSHEDMKRYREINWNHRKLALLTYYHVNNWKVSNSKRNDDILTKYLKVKSSNKSHLYETLTKLILFSGSHSEPFRLDSGLLQYIIRFL